MGHEQHSVSVRGVSALPPKADIRQALSMSALCHKRTLSRGKIGRFRPGEGN